MSTIRLNSTIRDTIVKHLMAHRFEKQEKALEEKKAALGDLAYQTVIDALPEREKALLAQVPDNWLRSRTGLHFSFPGNYELVDLNGTRYLPEKLIRTHQLEAIVEYERARNSLKQEKRDAKHAAQTALGKVTTVKRLLEEWPEIKPIVDKALPESHQPKPPSLRKEDLNKQFAL